MANDAAARGDGSSGRDEPSGRDVRAFAAAVDALAAGRGAGGLAPDLDPATPAHLPGLAPNNARLSVRFHHVGTFGDLAVHLARHWDDTAIEPRCLGRTTPPARQLAQEAAAHAGGDGRANVVVSVEGEERARVPVHQIGGVTGFGRVAMSPALMGALAEGGVTMTFMGEHGRFLARVEGPVSGNVVLRRARHRASGDAVARAPPARAIVIGKAVNQRAVIRRALRDHRGTTAPGSVAVLEAAERRLADIARRALKPGDTDWLRGLEGEAAQVYFGGFDAMIRADHPALRFSGRSRRPPMDAINALLSFLYALLAADCRSALEGVGLDPQIGFLHADRPGRPSLALDLMEEFRPWFADRLALSLVNRPQLNARDFVTAETGAVRMTDDGRRAVLVAYQERKRDVIRHDFLGEKATLGLLWRLQARLLALYLRGEIDGYPPFVWK